MNPWHWWLVILGAGAGSYALRVTPFLWHRLYRLGQDNFRFLTYVSFAIAAGIVSRSVVYSGGHVATPAEIAVKIAGIAVALALLRLTRNLPLALFAGVGAAVLLDGVWL